ncbi:MAG: heme lyase CcmF/NrfE family subunit [Gammaproteobacteria bacterium]|nr:heme lyase CcmF/NrfE family subunit [Gammaproteobacteria bacterium]
MIPELGHFSLFLCLMLALTQIVCGYAGAHTGRSTWMAAVKPAAVGQFVFAVISFACLVYAFLNDDFTVQYVASNSNTALPEMYKVAAVWGGHEGSLLLWILIQSAWSFAVASASRDLPDRFASRVIATLGLVSAGFLLFILFTSNPFARLMPAAFNGRDLNPLLQDFGLAIHPPILYLGYVGFSVAFAFAIAAMLSGDVHAQWARWTRRWTTLAWLFLTIGIALGSWWAYYELGWGGWWFWDAVENASFMPWLVGTALIHSLAVTDKRGLFKSWTLLLSILAFSLSLLGTFLVRSGVLVSVHAFASDPERGRFILIFLGFMVGGALLLYSLTARKFVAQGKMQLVSRETALLVNNVLLVCATFVVLFGTLYPLINDALNMPKVSVGAQWFNTFFVPITLVLMVFLGVGMHTIWRQSNVASLKNRLKWPLLVSAVIAVAFPLLVYQRSGVLIVLGTFTALWVVLSSLTEPWLRYRRGLSLRSMPRTQVGMLVAHVGVALTVLGVTYTSAYSTQRDVALQIDAPVSIGGYEFTLTAFERVNGPNYVADQASISVTRNGKPVTELTPQKRTYLVQTMPMTESAIHPRLQRDIYVALGEPLGEGAYSFRLQIKPLVRFIWLGALVMALGGFLTLTDRRYRAVPESKASREAASAGLAS